MTAVAHILGLDLTLSASEPLTVDVITDLIEAVTDELDGAGYTPTVRTAGAGLTFTMTVEVVTPSDDLHVFEEGVHAITTALKAAGLDVSVAHVEQPTFRALQVV